MPPRFKVGDIVRHRTSGEKAVVIEQHSDPQFWVLSRGLDPVPMRAHESTIELHDTATQSGPVGDSIIESRFGLDLTDGRRVGVLQRRGIGLVCKAGNELLIVTADKCADPTEFHAIRDQLGLQVEGLGQAGESPG